MLLKSGPCWVQSLNEEQGGWGTENPAGWWIFRWSLGGLEPRSCLGQGHLCPLPDDRYERSWVFISKGNTGALENGFFTIRWPVRKGKWILSKTANYKMIWFFFFNVQLPFERLFWFRANLGENPTCSKCSTHWGGVDTALAKLRYSFRQHRNIKSAQEYQISAELLPGRELWWASCSQCRFPHTPTLPSRNSLQPCHSWKSFSTNSSSLRNDVPMPHLV